eukprot:NODE_1548_length_913_cov_107.425926_g1202_i0.p1 GENE.NODE_1548_length_913_cov_107.425926_g1202_i0~~NODE_1548_length_913_cov_107.425926_g1202_i0.p1  ORF type:complete len:265 (-),score=68.71 NODE_1548_length_913_cov_107.425926_g1202_i0:119-853(-)
MRCLLLLLVAFAICADAKVLMEVSFDLALQQESPTGYTASHTVGEYLNDPNLNWLRYFHTLVSGQPGNAPMRVAFMEFKDMKSWATFENTNLERTHILYDLFWINWRRVLWTEDESTASLTGKTREEGKNGGFVWTFRYTAKEGSEAALVKAKNAAFSQLDGADQFIERHTYTAGAFQSTFQHLLMYEFTDMPSLSQAILENTKFTTALNDMQSLMSSYASTILVPSADAQGGQIFKGTYAAEN